MDALTVWKFIESLAEVFYDPLIFWSVPLLPAIVLEVIRRARR